MRRYCCPRTYFYPRPPRGGRLGVIGQYGHRLIFLSTPSARRATTSASPIEGKKQFLSTPSARRATKNNLRIGGVRRISIHALREEGDHILHAVGQVARVFLSTPSARRATAIGDVVATSDHISIHALREEGDGLHPPG